jgi:protease secretion system outer membrane protein
MLLSFISKKEIIASCLLSVPILAQGNSLSELYEAALTHNPGIQIAMLDEKTSAASLKSARSSLLPQLSLTANESYNNSKFDYDAYTESREYKSNSLGLTLRQSIIDVAATATNNKYKAARDASDLLLPKAEQDLALLIIQTYLQAAFTRNSLNVIKEKQDNLKMGLEATEALLKNGEATITDVLETVSELELGKAEVNELLTQLKSLTVKLEELTGTDLSIDSISAVTDISGFYIDEPIESFKASYVQDNLSLNHSRKLIEVADLDIAVAKSAYYPTLSLQLTSRLSESDSVSEYQSSTTANSVGLLFSFSLFDGWRRSAETEKYTALKLRAERTYDNEMQNGLTSISDAYFNLANERSRIQALDSAIEASSRLVTATKKSIQGGERSNLDLIIAINKNQNSLISSIDAKYNYMISLIQLKGLTGTLDRSYINYLSERLR